MVERERETRAFVCVCVYVATPACVCLPEVLGTGRRGMEVGEEGDYIPIETLTVTPPE